MRFKALFFAAVCASPAVQATPHTFLFQPEGCEFKAEMPGTPEIQTRWRGESLLTVAKAHTEDSTMRASCTDYFVQDWDAFRKDLANQLAFAARQAGVQNASTEIRETETGIVASFWGYRGEGAYRTLYRSDTYVGARSFMEVVVNQVESSEG